MPRIRLDRCSLEAHSTALPKRVDHEIKIGEAKHRVVGLLRVPLEGPALFDEARLPVDGYYR